MKNPRLYVFGVPDGFNLFEGDSDDISYFQIFYDGSKENTKLSIHRKVNGQVSYSYLRYRLLSVEGRAGAFFGISVIFNNKYCGDTAKLYRLFDTVYNEILKNKVLLEETKENTSAQAKFLIHSFKQKETEVKSIERFILYNIENRFTNDIYPLDSTFKKGKSSLIRKINSEESNNTILEALRNYSWVSISPEYPAEYILDETSKEDEALKDTSAELKDVIIKNDSKILTENIDVLTDRYELEILSKIENFLHDLEKIMKKEINEIQNQINQYKTALENKLAEKRNASVVIGENRNKIGEGAFNSKKLDNHTRKKIFGSFSIGKSVWKYAAIFIITICMVFFLFKQCTLSADNCPACIPHLDKFSSYLAENKFKEAQSELDSLKTRKSNIDIAKMQNQLTEAVINHIQHQSQSEDDKAKKNDSIKDIATSQVSTSIANKQTNNADCSIEFNNKSKKASIWYKELKQNLNKKNFKYVIAVCDRIIEHCSGQIKEQAKNLKSEAEQKKKSAAALTEVNNKS